MSIKNSPVRWLDDEPITHISGTPMQVGVGEVGASASVSVGLLTLLVIGGIVYYVFFR